MPIRDSSASPRRTFVGAYSAKVSQTFVYVILAAFALAALAIPFGLQMQAQVAGIHAHSSGKTDLRVAPTIFKQ